MQTRWMRWMMRTVVVAAVAATGLAAGAARADDLDDAMVGYLRAIRSGDTAGFLRCIAPDRTWRFVSYRAGTSNIVSHTTFTADETSDAIRGQHGLYFALFSGTPKYRYGERVGAHPLPAWHRNGNTYRLPDSEGISFVYWRQEDGRWYIDSIGDDSP